MGIEEKRKLIINVMYYAIIALLVYLAVRYAYPLLAPFLIGLFVAFAMRKPIGFLTRKLCIRRGFVAVLVITLLYATVGTLVGLVLVRLIIFAKDLFWDLPRLYRSELEPHLRALASWFESVAPKMAPELSAAISDILTQLVDSIGNMVSSFSVRVVRVATDYLTTIPDTLMRIVLAVIASFFFAVDYPRFVSFLHKTLPEKAISNLFAVKDYLRGTLFKIVRSYFFILCITYAEVAIGLCIIGVKGFAWVAILIAILDILPILGTGTVLIPWACISFLQGRIGQGLAMLVLYAVVFVVRQTIEPRIVGHQVGLHPLVILISMFVGVQVFGALGLFGLPVLVALLRHLYQIGKLPWKPKQEKILDSAVDHRENSL